MGADILGDDVDDALAWGDGGDGKGQGRTADDGLERSCHSDATQTRRPSGNSEVYRFEGVFHMPACVHDNHI